MVTMLGRATLAIARRGQSVILGRGSFVVLGGFTDVLNVRVQASLRSRIERCLAEDRPPDLERAEGMVRENDRIRRSFVESMYGIRWDATSSFDLVVNTDKVRVESAAAWIAEAARGLAKSASQPSTADIAADPVLDQVVADVLSAK